MRYGLVLMLPWSLLISAQSVTDLPSCSLACFATAVATTTCDIADYSCQCTPANRAAIKDSVTPCLAKSKCTITELGAIQAFGQTFCPSYLATASSKSAVPSITTSLSNPSNPSSTASPKPQSGHGSPTSTVISPPLTSTSSSPTMDVTSILGAGFEGTRWQVVHHTSDANRGPAIEAVCITLLVIAASVVGFRLYARLKTQQLRQVAQGPGWDELFACVALLLVLGIVACVIAGVQHGMGKYQDHQTAPELREVIKIIYSFTLLITLCFCSLKLSILSLYLRMTPEKSHRVTIYLIMGFVVAYTVAVFFANMFECTPISDFWNIAKVASNSMGCVNIITMDIITNSWSAFEDLVIWTLPIPVLWNLKVPRARKVGLYTLIGISSISVACAFVRVAFFVIWINSAEISWNFPLYPLLCTIEASVALVTSSLPAIYALFRKPAPEHRRSVAVNADNEKGIWNSQGSTLQSAATTADEKRRSRWSFLAWGGIGVGAAKKQQEGHSIAEEEAPPPVGGPAAAAAGGGDAERPGTQRTMKAYVSSTDEARSVSEVSGSGSHRRKFSVETESLCYVGKGADNKAPSVISSMSHSR